MFVGFVYPNETINFIDLYSQLHVLSSSVITLHNHAIIQAIEIIMF